MASLALDFQAEVDRFNSFLASARQYARALDASPSASPVASTQVTLSDSGDARVVKVEEHCEVVKREEDCEGEPPIQSLPQVRKRRASSSPASGIDEGRTRASSLRRGSRQSPLHGTGVNYDGRRSNPTRRIAVQVPRWYQQLKKSKSRARGVSSVVDSALASLRASINGSRPDGSQRHLDNLIEEIHKAMFLEVNAQVLRDHRLLNEEGLSSIFSSEATETTRYPFYTKLDAEELWHKWAGMTFTNNLMHGIVFNKSEAPRIEPDYPLRRDGGVFGENKLVNGQWWPSQLCLVRDGAHKSSQGGIAGRAGLGAWSVLLGAGKAEGGGQYPDHDQGDVVDYCGTDRRVAGGEVSEFTLRMMESLEAGHAIRLIRSSKAVHSSFRPKAGFRYDGLYKIMSFELLDASRQRHRFRLVRLPGQHPIRYQGPGVRPTSQELAAWKKLHAEKRLIVNDL